MSTPQGRPRRHGQESGKLRQFHSFLTCRLIHTLPQPAGDQRRSPESYEALARGHGHESLRVFEPHLAHERLMVYDAHGRRGVRSAASAANTMDRAEIQDLRIRFAPPPPGSFIEGVESELFSFWDIVLGMASSPGLLRHPRIADAAQQTLHTIDGALCALDAYVILPTHVHMLFSQQVGLIDGPTPEQVSAVFRMTVEQRANQYLGRTGAFWHKDDFHRYLRSIEDIRAALSFIRQAPVRSGLVEKPEEWEWLYVREGEVGVF
jgi:REP element-mobilizing transposase RayT